MSSSTSDGTEYLIERLSEAVRLSEVHAITERIKQELKEIIASGKLRLPDRFRVCRTDCYARRLLHSDNELGYTVVVMAWGPDQRTPLHDHAGIWCVEGVVEGEIDVTRYKLSEEKDGLYRFEEMEHILAGVGTSGSLIPPFEYHILANALTDRPSITFHVYGGEMDHCCVYEEREDGWCERVRKSLAYHD